MDKPVEEQQASNDHSTDKREEVCMQTFLSDMNGGAKIYDYRLFSGIEPVDGPDSVTGIVLAVNYEVVAEEAPEAPEMLGPDLMVTEAFRTWNHNHVLKREAHLRLTEEDLIELVGKTKAAAYERGRADGERTEREFPRVEGS